MEISESRRSYKDLGTSDSPSWKFRTFAAWTIVMSRVWRRDCIFVDGSLIKIDKSIELDSNFMLNLKSDVDKLKKNQKIVEKWNMHNAIWTGFKLDIVSCGSEVEGLTLSGRFCFNTLLIVFSLDLSQAISLLPWVIRKHFSLLSSKWQVSAVISLITRHF